MLARNCNLARGILEGRTGYSKVGERTSPSASDVCWGAGYGKYSGNEVQRIVISGSPTGGTIPFEFDGQTMAAGVAYNSTSTTIKAAFEALSNINLGDIDVYGNVLPDGPIAVEFRGQYANTDVPLITGSTASLTGGSPVLTVTELVKGGDFEEFIVILQKSGDSTATAYSVDPTTGVYTSIATGLDASDWYIEQYGGRIYALNGIDGLHYKVLGGAWDNGVSTAPPIAPYRQMQMASGAYYDSPSGAEPVISTVGDYSGWGTDPTETVISDANANVVYFVVNAAITTPTTVQMDVTFSANQTLQFRDVVVMQCLASGSAFVADWSKSTLKMVNADGTPAVITPSDHAHHVSYTGAAQSECFHFTNISRSLRDNVLKFRVTLSITTAAVNSRFTLSFSTNYGWPLSQLPVDMSVFTSTPNYGVLPTGQVRYAYSYVRIADGAESSLSPEVTISVPEMSPFGYRFKGVLDVSPELGATDKLYLYRQEQSTGKWRRIMNTDCSTYGFLNTGAISITDGWMEADLAGFPEYTAGVLGTWPSSEFKSLTSVNMGVWKQSLAIVTRRLLLCSWMGNPEKYAPSPDDLEALKALDENDDDQGVTEYVSANRAEDVIGAHGQDALYLATASAWYVKVGDKPLTSTPPRRLPGSRGPVGTRASSRYGNGVLSASQDGLWNYAVSRAFSGVDDGSDAQIEMTKDDRQNWLALLGTSYSGMVVVSFRDDVWAWNGAKYIRMSQDGHWSSGEFADSVKAALPIATRGLYFVDSKGRLMIMDSGYTDNGEPVEWTYETGDEDTRRMAIRNMIISATGTPTINITTSDGLGGTKSTGKQPMTINKSWTREFHLNPSFRTSFSISGISGADSVDNLTVCYDQEVGEGRGN